MQFKKRFGLVLSCIAMVIFLVVLLTAPTSHLKYQESGRTIIIEMKNSRICMDMEQFIPLVLMAELPFDSPKELLKTQAVVVRTNILHSMGGKNVIKADDIGLPYKTPAQLKDVWITEEKSAHAEKVSGIVANLTGFGEGYIFTKKMNWLYQIIGETEERVLKIEGKTILPLFHQLSNGKTRSGKDNLGEDFAYLLSVDCDSDMESAGYDDYVKLSVNEIFLKLKKHGIVIFEQGNEVDGANLSANEFVKKLVIEKKDEQGYVKSFSLGDVRIDGVDFANALKLKSCALDVECEGNQVVFSTRGCGHGFGMSLNYAKCMALQGKDYKEILTYFYDAALVRNVY